jgi:putative spermidine/putrescine transport system permease protein
MLYSPYESLAGRCLRYAFYGACALILVFLVAPIFAIVPLSFSSGTLLVYPPPGWSLRWYEEIVRSPDWRLAFANSLVVGAGATALATTLGTLAAVGLTRLNFAGKGLVLALLISPMIIPTVLAAVGMLFFYAEIGLGGSYLGLILAHAALAAPFVVVTVSAALAGFDATQLRAAASLGAPPMVAFFRVVLPQILPGVVSGALFAFATSFDEVIVILFMGTAEQRTLPRQMFSDLRENISPATMAVAALLVVLAVALMLAMEALRRRGERLRAARTG